MKSTYSYLHNIQGLRYKVASLVETDIPSSVGTPDVSGCANTPLALPSPAINTTDANLAIDAPIEPERPDNINIEHANNAQRAMNDSTVPPKTPPAVNLSNSWSNYRRSFEVIKQFMINNWQLVAMLGTNIGLEATYNLSDYGPAVGGIIRGIDATLFMHWVSMKSAQAYVKGKIIGFNGGLRKELDRVYKTFINGKDLSSIEQFQVANNMKLYFTVSSLVAGIGELRSRIQLEGNVSNLTGVNNPAVLSDLINYLDSGIIELTALLQDAKAPQEVKNAVARLAAFTPEEGDNALVEAWLKNSVLPAFSNSEDQNVQIISTFFQKRMNDPNIQIEESFLIAFDKFLQEDNSQFQSKIKSLQRRLLLTQATQVIMAVSLLGILGFNTFTQDVSAIQKIMTVYCFLASILYYAVDGATNFYNQLRTFFDKNLPDFGVPLTNKLDNPMMSAIRYPFAHNNMEWVFQDLISNVLLDGNFVGTENIFSSASMLRRQSYGIVTILNAAKARYELLKPQFSDLLKGFSENAKRLLPLLLSVDKYHPVATEISIQRAVNNVFSGYKDNKTGYLTTFETLLLGFPQQDAGRHRTEQGRLIVEAVLFRMKGELNKAGLSDDAIRILVERFNIGDFNHYDFKNMMEDALVNDLGMDSTTENFKTIVKTIIDNKTQYQNEAVIAYTSKEGIPAQQAAAIMHQMQVVFQQESMFERIAEIANLLRKGITIDEEGNAVNQDALKEELQGLLAKAFLGTDVVNQNIVEMVNILVASGEQITQTSYDAFTLKDPMSDVSMDVNKFSHLVNVRRRIGIMGLNEKKLRGENFEANQVLTLFYSIKNMVADKNSGNQAGYRTKLANLYFILTGEQLTATTDEDIQKAFEKVVQSYKSLLTDTLTDFNGKSTTKNITKYNDLSSEQKNNIDNFLSDNQFSRKYTYNKQTGALTVIGQMTKAEINILKTIFPTKIDIKTLYDMENDSLGKNEEHFNIIKDFDVTSAQAEQHMFDIVTRLNLIGVVDTGRLILENGGLPGTAPGEQNSLTLAVATRAAMLAGQAEANFYDDESQVNNVLANSARFGRYDAYFNMAFKQAEEGIRQGLGSQESLDMITTKIPSLRTLSMHVIEKAVDAFLPSYEENQLKIGQMYLGMGSGLARDTRILKNFVESYRDDSLGLRTHLDPKIDAVAVANAELVAKGSELPPKLKELIDFLYLNYMFQGDARGNIRLFGKTTGSLTYDQLAELVISSLENGQMDVRFRHAARDFYIDLGGKDIALLKEALGSGFLTAGDGKKAQIKDAVRAYLKARETQVQKLSDLEEVVMNHEIKGGNVLGDKMLSLYNEPIFRLIYMKLAGVSYEQDVAPMNVVDGYSSAGVKSWLSTLNAKSATEGEYKKYNKMSNNIVLDAYSDTSTTTSPELEELRRKPAKLPAFITGGKADQTNINSSHYGRGRIANQMRGTRLYEYIAQRLQIISGNSTLTNIEIPPMVLNRFEYEVTSTLHKSQSEMMKSNAIYSTALQFMVDQLIAGKTPQQAGAALVTYWKDNLGLTDADVVGGSLKGLAKTCVSFAKVLKVNMAIPNLTGGISAIYAISQGQNLNNVDSAYSGYINGIALDVPISSADVSAKIDEYINKYITEGKFSSKEATELRSVAERMKRNILINEKIKDFTGQLLATKDDAAAFAEKVKETAQKIAEDDLLDQSSKRYLIYYMQEVYRNIAVGKGLSVNDWLILKGEWYTFPAQFLYRTPGDMNKEGPSGRRLLDYLLPWKSTQTMYQSFLFTRPMTMEEVNALNSSAQGQFVGLTKQVPEVENFRGLQIPVGNILRTFADFFDKQVAEEANVIIGEYSKFQKMIREASNNVTTADTAESLISISLADMAVNKPNDLINMAKAITGDSSINNVSDAIDALLAIYDAREFTIDFIQKRLDALIRSKLSINTNPEYTQLNDYFDENVMPGSMLVLYEKMFGLRKPSTHTNQDVDNFNFVNIFLKVFYFSYDWVTGLFQKTRHGMIQGSQNIAEKSQPVTTPFANLDQIWNEVLLKHKGLTGGLYANGCFFIQRTDIMNKSQMHWQDVEQVNAAMTSDSRISRMYNNNKKFWSDLKQNSPMVYNLARAGLLAAAVIGIPSAIILWAGASSLGVLSIAAMVSIAVSLMALTVTSVDVKGNKASDINSDIKKNFMYSFLATSLGGTMVATAMLAMSFAQSGLDKMGQYGHQFTELGLIAFIALFAAGITTWVTQNVGFAKIREKITINALGRTIQGLNNNLESLVDKNLINVAGLSDEQKSEFRAMLEIYANCKVDENYVNRNRFFAGYVRFFNDLFDVNTTDAQKKSAFDILTKSNGAITVDGLKNHGLGMDEDAAKGLVKELTRLSLVSATGELSESSLTSTELQDYLTAKFSAEQTENINHYLNLNFYRNLMKKTDSKDFVKQIYEMLKKQSGSNNNVNEMLNDFCKMMGKDEKGNQFLTRDDLDKLFNPDSKATPEEKENIAKEIQKRFYATYTSADAVVPGEVPVACKKFISRFEDYKTTSATEDAFSWITNYFMGWNTQAMPGGMPLGQAGANTSFDVVVPQRGGRWYSSTSAFLSYALINDVYQNWQTRPASTASGTVSTLLYGYSGLAKMQLLMGVPLVALGVINPFYFLTTMGLTVFTAFSYANYSAAMQTGRLARVTTGAWSYGVDLALYAESKIHMPTALKETLARGGIKPEQTVQIMNMSWLDILKKPLDPYSWLMVMDKLTNPVTSPLHNAGFNITVEMAGSTQPKFHMSFESVVSIVYSITSGLLFMKMMDSLAAGDFMQFPYFAAFLFWSYVQLKNALGTEQMSRLGANFLIEGKKQSRGKTNNEASNNETGKILQGAGENTGEYRKILTNELFKKP
jgi:hypothetical protein